MNILTLTGLNYQKVRETIGGISATRASGTVRLVNV